MQQSGLLDETLVVCLGEMGRMPRGSANWGRSDKDAAYPQDKPVSPQNLGATIFHALGISPDTRIHDALGRPVPVMEGGEPLTELFG